MFCTFLSVYRFQIRFQKTSLSHSARIRLWLKLSRVFMTVPSQKMSVHNFGGQQFGRHSMAENASSTNTVRLPRRRFDAARALIHVIAKDAAHRAARNGHFMTCFGCLVS
jgi:hypothetical protein